MRSSCLAPALLVLLLPSLASAATVAVSDEASLLAAIAAAAPGDEIVLADGVYELGANVSCSTPGTAAEPIVVRAENPLGAQIRFDALEGFKVDAAHWRFEGLDIRGVCANDSDCEHAFHVVGAAHGFVLRRSRVVDFNAQLKVNASLVNGSYVAPDDGLVELCDIGDTSGRQTSAPVTKLNIDGGLRWTVRDNYLHDFHKDGGNTISYGAFMKSGGADGLFERNLVVCDAGASSGGARIGLSFGGGGTGNQFCAPAYDANVPCDPEHSGGTMRNNVIVGCSDVGIYLNRSSDTSLLHNTLIGTTGIDFRFASTSGHADGNVLAGTIRDRDGATHTEGTNLESVAQSSFDAWYVDPLAGDLSLLSTPTELIGAGSDLVDDDYCARARPATAQTLGALEHSLGDCATFPPPGPGEGGAGGAGGGGGGAGGEGVGGEGSGAGGPAGPGVGSGGAGSGGDAAEGDGGCGCRAAGAAAPRGALGWMVALTVALGSARRRLRSRARVA